MFDLFYFQALTAKESRVRKAMGQSEGERALRKGLTCGHSAQLDALWVPQDTLDVEELNVIFMPPGISNILPLNFSD